MAVAPALRIGVDVLALAGTAGFAVTAWRRRSEPTAGPLLGLAAVLLLAAVVHLGVADLRPVRRAVGMALDGATTDRLWILSARGFAVVAMGLWFLFAVEYTDRGGQVTSIAVGAAVVVPVAVLAITAVSIPLDASGSPVVGTVLRVLALLMTSLAVVGAMFVLAEAAGANALPFRGILLLAAGAVVLSFTPLTVSILQEPVVLPATLLLASALFAVAVDRYPTFETLPAARVVGRDRVIDGMTDAVVVVDRAGDVRDLNRAAERTFDASGDTLGRPLAALAPSLPPPESLATADDATRYHTGDGVVLAVTADRVTDARGRPLGYLLFCRDVTDRRNRERRLSVLNQFLTGAVRERMAAVADDAATLRRAEVDTDVDTPRPDPATVSDRIRARATDLVTLVAQAREIERALSEGGGPDDGQPADVGAAVRAVAEWTDGDRSAPSVDGPDRPVSAGVDPSLLRTLLTLLVEAGDADLVVVNGDPPEISVVGDWTPAEAGAAPDASIRMTRLVLDDLGGRVSMPGDDAGRERVVVELPPADDGETTGGAHPPIADEGGDRA